MISTESEEGGSPFSVCRKFGRGQPVMSDLGLCNFVGLYHARWLCNPNCQSLYAGDSFVKRAVRFGITQRLIKQLREVVKQGVLVLAFKAYMRFRNRAVLY